jgi:protein O-mannosyl-transferase
MAKPNKFVKNTEKTIASTVFEEKNHAIPAFFENVQLQMLVIFAFAFLLYANTLWHQFVMDDAIVITDNMFTQKGVAGIGGILSEDTFFGFFKERGKEALVSGGRYRPLTLVIFAMLWQVTHSPFAFHFLTVVLFGVCCVVLFKNLRQLLDNQQVTVSKIVPFAATILFAAHPIHTEVVANVKGCDEILTLLLSLGALFFTVKSARSDNSKLNFLGATIFFLALLSKENAITFLAIVPLALVLFTDLGWAKSLVRSMPYFAVAAIFMLIRTRILGWHFGAEPMELMNNPFLKIVNNQWVAFSASERAATIILTLGKYVQLLFCPCVLTHDYYPRHIDMQQFSNAGVIGSFLLYAGLIFVAIKNFNKNKIITFSIFFYLITLSIVSNIVFPVGTNMGERFAFMPSVGFCLGVTFLLFFLFKNNKNQSIPLFVLGIIAFLFSLKTVTRNPVWQSNDRIFLTDIQTSKNSAKLCNAAGGTLVDGSLKEKDETKRISMLKEAAVHLNNAIKIHPTYKNAFLLLGNCYNYQKLYEKSAEYYREALRIDPDYKEAKGNIAISLREGGKQAGEVAHDTQKALKLLEESYKFNPNDLETTRLLGVANGILGNHAAAIQYFQKVVDGDPKQARALFDLGTAYIFSGNSIKGKEMQEKAKLLDPAAFQQKQ